MQNNKKNDEYAYYKNTEKSIIIKKLLNENIIDTNYNYEELCKLLKIDIFEHNPKIIMPFIGIIFEKDCKAITVNYGLYTQCKKVPIDNCNYCINCNNGLNKNNKLLYGNVYERFNNSKNNKNNKYNNKPVCNYIKFLESQNRDITQTLDSLKSKNITIPDTYLKKEKKTRGRPKKNINTQVNDTDDENEEIFEPCNVNIIKKEEDISNSTIETNNVGRPKTIIKEALFDENISKETKLRLKLIEQQSKNDLLNKEEYFSDDEIMVRKIYINHVTKLTDGANVYDIDTFEVIGNLKDFDLSADTSDDEE